MAMGGVNDLAREMAIDLGLDPSTNWTLSELIQRAINSGVLLRNSANASFVSRPRGSNVDLHIYGNSFAVIPGYISTPGKEWPSLVRQALQAKSATSWAVNATRSVDTAYFLIRGEGFELGVAAHPAGAAASHPGVSTRQGISIVDTSINDIGKYPNMNPGPAVPALITGVGGDRYKDGIKHCQRTILAFLCHESWVSQEAATGTTGVWSSSAGSHFRGATVRSSSAAGATRTYSITPPQSGPMAGVVYHLSYALESTGFTNSPWSYTIDGGAANPVTAPLWEQYVGLTAANVLAVPVVQKIVLPVDGAAHTIVMTHTGAAGNVLYSNGFLIMSENPGPIFVKQAPFKPKVGTVFNAAAVATMGRNWKHIEDNQAAVVAEFPTAFYVKCTVTDQGRHSTDGLHLNDLGHEQAANDVIEAIQRECKAYLINLEVAARPSSIYGVY